MRIQISLLTIPAICPYMHSVQRVGLKCSSETGTTSLFSESVGREAEVAPGRSAPNPITPPRVEHPGQNATMSHLLLDAVICHTLNRRGDSKRLPLPWAKFCR